MSNGTGRPVKRSCRTQLAPSTLHFFFQCATLSFTLTPLEIKKNAFTGLPCAPLSDLGGLRARVTPFICLPLSLQRLVLAGPRDAAGARRACELAPTTAFLAPRGPALRRVTETPSQQLRGHGPPRTPLGRDLRRLTPLQRLRPMAHPDSMSRSSRAPSSSPFTAGPPKGNRTPGQQRRLLPKGLHRGATSTRGAPRGAQPASTVGRSPVLI